MADVTIRTEWTLGRQELVLLARLVRVLEKWQGVEVPAALHAAIEETAQVAGAVKDAIINPAQGA